MVLGTAGIYNNEGPWVLAVLNLKPQVRVSHLIFEKKNLLNKDLNGVVSHGFL